jgi:non-canonical (house-cleaning) NTP pyrophosphatase
MTLYLTSKNKDKLKATQIFLTQFDLFNQIICVESESGIEGGQPYGLEETKQGCITRTKQFKNTEDFVSIENGFVKETDKMWYDIAYVYISINNTIYEGWSEKRYFPKELYNKTPELIRYLEKNSMSRYEQLKLLLEKVTAKDSF